MIDVTFNVQRSSFTCVVELRIAEYPSNAKGRSSIDRRCLGSLLLGIENGYPPRDGIDHVMSESSNGGCDVSGFGEVLMSIFGHKGGPDMAPEPR
jgi:hypothetical protein